jgi:hypothetical protein
MLCYLNRAIGGGIRCRDERGWMPAQPARLGGASSELAMAAGKPLGHCIIYAPLDDRLCDSRADSDRVGKKYGIALAEVARRVGVSTPAISKIMQRANK